MSQVDKVKSAVATTKVRAMSVQVAEVRQNINLLHEAMKSVMKDKVHFGIIPGCDKPSLFKPGAEVIIALFKLSTDPVVNDLSKDGEIRYQVKVNISTRDGVFIGSGIGECSSGEEKYSWRASVCDEEFESFPETMRRIKFKKYKDNISQIKQVRTAPSDMANTILKMAKKRGLIDAVLTATGASDIFSQDIEDLPEEYVAQETGANAPPKADPITTAQDAEFSQSSQNAGESASRTGKVGANPISEPQRKRFYAICKGQNMSDEAMKEHLWKFGYTSSKDIDRSEYEAVCDLGGQQ